MVSAVKLIGLDFGTTTSSAVIASARLTHNAVTGRTDLGEVCECYRSDIVFTPYRGGEVDEERAAVLLEQWLAGGRVRREEIFGGGALLTGLAAQGANAARIVSLIRRRLGEALIATAEDPCLESWLAFLGSCADLSRAHPDTPFINLDIGGGTTNLALGQNGEVLRTGCLFVGARHVQVEPGTYRVTRLSRYARELFDHLGIARGPGDALAGEEVAAVLDFYARLLEAAAAGRPEAFAESVAALHQQVPFRRSPAEPPAVVTFSGGVGELIYAARQGKPLPPPTYFGDLGIDLARRLLRSPLAVSSGNCYIPAGLGRATVYGLLRHSTQISGSTLFLPFPEMLPLRDLPILGTVSERSADSHIADLVHLVMRSPRGGCLRVALPRSGPALVRAAGEKIAAALEAEGFPAGHPLVLLVTENVGKVLGQYVTRWGSSPLRLVVVDEIAVRDAQYAHLGSLRDQVVPVSFYGLNEGGIRHANAP
jgi:ethanolamine utilization protein EutA